MAPRKKVKLSHNDRKNPPRGGAVSKGSTHADGSHRDAAAGPSRKGCLEVVQSLPLDISFEVGSDIPFITVVYSMISRNILQIFGHLHPKDLLNSARTSKVFRSFFFSRSNSISIWKASLSRVEGLPEKPAFLSEPAFAHMLFFTSCQVRG